MAQGWRGRGRRGHGGRGVRRPCLALHAVLDCREALGGRVLLAAAGGLVLRQYGYALENRHVCIVRHPPDLGLKRSKPAAAPPCRYPPTRPGTARRSSGPRSWNVPAGALGEILRPCSPRKTRVDTGRFRKRCSGWPPPPARVRAPVRNRLAGAAADWARAPDVRPDSKRSAVSRRENPC